ncbi:hypothetical protein GIB67_004360 [Kingdonia uniflora]|uniref:Neprosin PEP catalytic domain-containing protein n=1 Tax=Kingdonia uniflora TaxID=39325 RepID=A0A7J7MRK8_9MAGN|nr:hypothetical protein GIB67_004360 [Kingdonia uniflora]
MGLQSYIAVSILLVVVFSQNVSAKERVSAVCSNTDHPELCNAVLKPGTTDLAVATLYTIDATISSIKHAKSFAQKLSMTIDARGKGILSDCHELYDDAISNLETSTQNLKDKAKADLRTNLSAALTDIDTCDQGFVDDERESPLKKSPDGDLIDCVLSHLQPAFDHSLLQGQKPLDPPETAPEGLNSSSSVPETFQSWTVSGEFCPEGTIPIRRTTEDDLLRASSFRKFGRKIRKQVRHDSTSSGHEHAVGYVTGDFYGAKASLNVWAPRVTNTYEFSLSQIWVISGSFGNDLNTIEAGWQASKFPISFINVSPELYGDNHPRFFTYWTDPKHGHWWLQFGSGLLVGYWPSVIFSHLRNHATMIQYGGEIYNSRSSGIHTSTQMGSGHFAGEGFGKSSYFRNLQVVDWDNNLIPASNLRLMADHSSCYDIQGGSSNAWGNYFYYGGPGRNVRCP